MRHPVQTYKLPAWELWFWSKPNKVLMSRQALTKCPTLKVFSPLNPTPTGQMPPGGENKINYFRSFKVFIHFKRP